MGIPNYVSSSPESLQEMKAAADDAADPGTARDLYYKLNQTILATYDSGESLCVIS